MQIEIAPIKPEFLHRTRLQGLDDQRQSVKKLTATGGEPCRDVLRRARAGEELFLASYCPFEQSGPYREFGPVFILANESKEETCMTRLPLTDANGTESYLRDSFVLRAYNAEEDIIDARLVSPKTAEQTIEEMFASEKTAFIHARFPTYGCYALRINRS